MKTGRSKPRTWLEMNREKIKRELPTVLAEEIIRAQNPHNLYTKCLAVRRSGVKGKSLSDLERNMQIRRDAQKLIDISYQWRSYSIGKPYARVKHALKNLSRDIGQLLELHDAKLRKMLVNPKHMVANDDPTRHMPADVVLHKWKEWADGELQARVNAIRAGQKEAEERQRRINATNQG